MRVLVKVSAAAGDERHVELELDSGKSLFERQMPARPGDAAGIADQLERLENDESQPTEINTIGQHLFDCLLTTEGWEAIGVAAADRDARTIELALTWPSTEQELNRLPWEAMHDGQDFICGHRQLCVAVTRIVADADETSCAAAVPAPPRVLFVIGPGIANNGGRTGTEVIGLLRDAERGAGGINPRIIDGATLRDVERVCQRFEPHIVHVVSHGDLEEKGGKVQLEEGDDHDGWANAQDLIGALMTSAGLPRLVVLTGCDSAAAGEHMDSLAVALVKGGVPKAIGMAGKISDPVARLFTRCFGRALIEGDALVEAMAHGRRAGLRRQSAAPGDSPSWALPSIYLAPSVPPGHAPIDVSGVAAAEKRAEPYDLRREPVFCIRRTFVRLFDDLLDPDDDLQALLAYAADGRQVGKTRMLHELAAKALRDGHVPVMIDDVAPDAELPKTRMQLALKMQRAMIKTRQAFSLAIPARGDLLSLVMDASGADDIGLEKAEERARRIKSFLKSASGDVDAGALRDALASDLAQLIADARHAPNESVGDTSQAVVILGGLGKWDEAAKCLLDDLLEPSGLGTPDERVPVFMVGSRADHSGTRLYNTARLESAAWAHVEELRPFEGDEAVSAYQCVLLHPWAKDPQRADGKPNPAYFVYTPTADGKETWHESFFSVGGIPGNFDDPMFYGIADALHRGGHLAKDDDAGALRLYTEHLTANGGG